MSCIYDGNVLRLPHHYHTVLEEYFGVEESGGKLEIYRTPYNRKIPFREVGKSRPIKRWTPHLFAKCLDELRTRK
jgi:hypothetical protein